MNHLDGDIDAQHASFRRFRRRRMLIIIAALAAIFALLFWQIGSLRPPSSLRLATGPEGEHEYAVAQHYQSYMAEQGVALEIVPTTGSLETIGLLQSGAVDAGFMLNAANFEIDADGLVGLASVGHVPIWIFYRDDLETDGPLQDLSDLRGLRVSLGAPLSGTRAVSKLLDAGIPTFGICLGHQIIGLALGGKTYKLKFGHHGSNQPVSDVSATNVQITAQNHNYAVHDEGLPSNVEITHRNLNDGTVEGLRLTDRPLFCVQYHPEASPGPHDADLLFARFARMVKEHAQGKGGRMKAEG